MEMVASSAENTNAVIKSSLHQSMLMNRSEDVDAVLSKLFEEKNIESISIYSKAGEVVFSSEKSNVGKTFDIQNSKECSTCHKTGNPSEAGGTSSMLRISDSAKGHRILSKSIAIMNEPVCASDQCHPKPSDQKVLGVLDTSISLEKVDTQLGSERNSLIFSSVLAVLSIEITAGFFIWFMVQRRLNILSDGTKQIKNGNLDFRLAVKGADEISSLAFSFNEMSEKLVSELKKSSSILSGIKEAINSLAPMSRQLVAITEQQSTGSVEQASSAKEAVSTSEEIATTAKHIANNSTEVSNFAEAAFAMTKDGELKLKITTDKFEDINDKMKSLEEAAQNLGEQSHEIADIMEIIRSINDQTNLLALNASIEAIGAGEHGKRFGVVAQEIRRLAMNTAKATKNIQDIVQRMNNSVASSIGLAEQGDKSVASGRNVLAELAELFTQIFNSSHNIVPRLKEIDLMTSQQFSASEQMSRTITEIEETARLSSTSIEQLQQSIVELDNVIKQLQSHSIKSE